MQIPNNIIEQLADMPPFAEEKYEIMWRYAQTHEEFMQISRQVWDVISTRKLRIKIRQSIKPFKG